MFIKRGVIMINILFERQKSKPDVLRGIAGTFDKVKLNAKICSLRIKTKSLYL